MTFNIHGIGENEAKDVAVVLGWIVAAYAVALIGARLANYHFKAGIVSLGIPGYINAGVYLASKFISKEVSLSVNTVAGEVPKNLRQPVVQAAGKIENDINDKMPPHYIPYQK